MYYILNRAYTNKCIYTLDSAYTERCIYIIDSAYTERCIYVLDSAYTERYLGTANDSPEGYDVSILHGHACAYETTT